MHDRLDNIADLKAQLRIIKMALESEKNQVKRYKEKYEREISWSIRLSLERERLQSFILKTGHAAGCATRRTRCDDPSCGNDGNGVHNCQLPFSCDCGFNDVLEIQEPIRDKREIVY